MSVKNLLYLFTIWLQTVSFLGATPYFVATPGAFAYEMDYATAFQKALKSKKLLFVFFTRPRGRCSLCDQVRRVYFESPSALSPWKKFFIFCCVEIEEDQISAQALFLKKLIRGDAKLDMSVPSCIIFEKSSLGHFYLLPLPKTARELEMYCENAILSTSYFQDESSHEDQ